MILETLGAFYIYIDESVLLMLSKRNEIVSATLGFAERPRSQDVRLLEAGSASVSHHRPA